MMTTSEPKTSQKIPGTIKTVNQHVLYIDTDRGTVFVPKDAALSINEDISDLTLIYSVGEQVEVRVVAQEQKNGCSWRGVKVYRNKPKNQSPLKSPNPRASTSTELREETELKVVRVTTVNEGLVYASHDEYGAIFIPGNSFDSSETRHLMGYLEPDDLLLVQLVEQPRMNGCQWKAKTATKYISKAVDDGLPTGFGVVEKVDPFGCRVRWTETDQEVFCPILTYTGGDMEKDVERLTDLIEEGEYVMFRVRLDQLNRIRAVNWYPVKSKGNRTNNLEIEVETKNLSESYTQTNTPSEYALLRTLFDEYPDGFARRPTMLKTLDPELVKSLCSS